MRAESCFGCKNMTSKTYGDGTVVYGCEKTPGVVLAVDGPFDIEIPIPIKEDCYEPVRVFLI